MTTQIERMEWQKLDHYGLSGYDADVIVSFSHASMVSFDVIVVVLPHISMFIMSIVILCFCISLFTYFFWKAKKIRTSTTKNSKSTKSKRIKTVIVILVVVCLIWMIFFSAKSRRDMGDSAKPEANIPNGFNRFSINRV